MQEINTGVYYLKIYYRFMLKYFTWNVNHLDRVKHGYSIQHCSIHTDMTG